MPRLNGKGPDGTSAQSGRKLGNCATAKDGSTSQYSLGQGMGKRRKAGLVENKHSNNN